MTEYQKALVARFGSTMKDSFPQFDFEKARRKAFKADGDGDFAHRETLVSKFGFAIPTPAVLEYIKTLGPIVEVGSGAGYWAYELQKLGVDLIATDNFEWHEEGDHHIQWSTFWTKVERMTALEAVQKYPDRVLLTVWPSYAESWPSEMLKAYRGQCVVYVGEGYYGCTGDKAFHEELDANWEGVKTILLPTWEGIHDYVQVFRRKDPSRTVAAENE
jgi:hypothetical protein